jgi:hypothetical protein
MRKKKQETRKKATGMNSQPFVFSFSSGGYKKQKKTDGKAPYSLPPRDFTPIVQERLSAAD